jgi:hypothetical protein
MELRDDVKNIINNFDPITLDKMNDVKLMDRTDIKYVFSIDQLSYILNKAVKDYRILEIKDKRVHTYNNQYFDTDDYQMYTKHHSGQLNRYKIRYRNYEVTNIAFLEIKFKSNKRRTIKKRIRNDFSKNLNTSSSNFIEKYSPFKPGDLTPILTNNFQRITLVHKSDRERITLDFNMTYSCSTSEKKRNHNLPKLAICEVKRKGYSNTSDFITILKSKGIRQTSMSKYCIGAALLYDDLKQNRFKTKLTFIENIHNSFNK